MIILMLAMSKSIIIATSIESVLLALVIAGIIWLAVDIKKTRSKSDVAAYVYEKRLLEEPNKAENKSNKRSRTMKEKIKDVAKHFELPGTYKGYVTITSGHINSTFKVSFDDNGQNKDYIFQRINTYVFKNPKIVMKNIALVTQHIREKLISRGENPSRLVLNYLSINGDNFYINKENEFWRCYDFIDNSLTYDNPNDLLIISHAGEAFGQFQKDLSDFPIDQLSMTIPLFHNTVHYYDRLKKIANEDKLQKANEVKEDINKYIEIENIAEKLTKLKEEQIIPLRVTHNDTKCNNVLFDVKTKEHLAVLDLDTVMPGIVAFDFGDAMRSLATTAAEDEPNLEKVHFDIDKFEAFSKGFLNEVKGDLTDSEKENMVYGAISMTIECGVRFLTDYLEGDVYFHVDYPEHNLVRSRNQYKLAMEMIEHIDDMSKIIKKYL